MEMYDSKAAAAYLRCSERTMQKWAQKGRIRFETIRKNGRMQRLYIGDDVHRVKQENAEGAVVQKILPVPADVSVSEPESRHPLKLVKTQIQNERALDTVSIVGTIMQAHKGELERVVGLVLDMQKAEKDAERQRLKDEREDARERWEAEHKFAKDRWEAEQRTLAAERRIRFRELKLRDDVLPSHPMLTPAKTKAARA